MKLTYTPLLTNPAGVHEQPPGRENGATTEESLTSNHVSRWIKLLRVLEDISHGNVPFVLKKLAVMVKTRHLSHVESGPGLMVASAMPLRMSGTLNQPDYVETGPESVWMIIAIVQLLSLMMSSQMPGHAE